VTKPRLPLADQFGVYDGEAVWVTWDLTQEQIA
jgi:hypothetical protein